MNETLRLISSHPLVLSFVEGRTIFSTSPRSVSLSESEGFRLVGRNDSLPQRFNDTTINQLAITGDERRLKAVGDAGNETVERVRQ